MILDFLNDGLGDVGDDDLLFIVEHEVKKTGREPKEVVLHCCPKCNNSQFEVYVVTTEVPEVWLKCQERGCGHIHRQ